MQSRYGGGKDSIYVSDKLHTQKNTNMKMSNDQKSDRQKDENDTDQIETPD